jgi:hypothetical protein
MSLASEIIISVSLWPRVMLVSWLEISTESLRLTLMRTYIFDGMWADWIREWNNWQRENEASCQRVEHRKRKPFATKHVSFAHNLVHDSPKIKSTPCELASSLKFGDFSCSINSPETLEFRPAQVGSSSLKLNLNSNSSVIAYSLVFGWLKG